MLATRLPWTSIEAAVAPKLCRQVHAAKPVSGQDLAGAFDGEFGGGVSGAGRPRLPVRLMVSLLYLKHSFNLSDEELVLRWAENVQWQFFSGMAYYEPRLPCDATQIGRFRRLLDEDGLEQLLKATIDCAVDIQAVKPDELERVNRHERVETDRFKFYRFDELIARDKARLDLFWLKDDSLDNLDDLPTPDVLQQEIIDHLEAALAAFRDVAASLPAFPAKLN